MKSCFRASPEGRTGVSSYTGEGRHLGGIIGILVDVDG